MIFIEDNVRGCGKMKKGGSYAIGSKGAGGTLNAWTWLLPATAYNVPPRKVTPVSTADLAQEPWIEFPLPLCPYVLLDHVGKDHYSPISFALECAKLGPSRRINPYGWPEDVRPPLLILFTHDEASLEDPFGMACPYSAIVEVFGESGSEALNWTPTWERPGFGYDAGARYNGKDHPMVAVYTYMELLKKQRRYSAFMRQHNIHFGEAIFGASWITNLVYVLEDEETEVPAEIAVKGFEAAVITEKEIAEE